jgi:O-antigen/teichoic acid export membrane protein
MRKYSLEAKVRLIPHQEATRNYRESVIISADATGPDEVQTPELPVVDIAQLPTQTRVRAISISSPSLLQLVDSISIADQPTSVLPVIPESLEVVNQVNLPAAQTVGDESYLRLIRNLVKNSGIYAISSLASPLVSLLLLPFLTHMLTHADYGALAVLDTMIVFVSSITVLGLDAAFSRVYLHECNTTRERLDAISTLSLSLLLVMIPITIIGLMAAPWLSVLVLGSPTYSIAIVLTVLLILLQNLTKPGLMWMRVENRSIPYSIVSIANVFLVAGGTLVLVGMLHMGVVGALIAMGLGNVIVVVCTMPLIFLRAGFYLRPAFFVSMLIFGVPYVMNYITTWVLQFSDRYLLGHLASLSVAANYSIAYSLGSGAAFIISTPFSMAWWVIIYSIARRDDASHMFKLIFRWYSFVLLFATLGLSLFSVSVLNLLFPASYHGQSQIISVIALSIVFNSIFVVFNLGMTLQRKTWLAFIALLISALLNFIMNIALIPFYGAMGAAFATLVAYIVLAIVSYLFNQLIYPVPFEVGLFLIALGIGIVLYFVNTSLAQGQSNLVVWGIHIGLLLLYLSTLAALGLLASCRKK